MLNDPRAELFEVFKQEHVHILKGGEVAHLFCIYGYDPVPSLLTMKVAEVHHTLRKYVHDSQLLCF